VTTEKKEPVTNAGNGVSLSGPTGNDAYGKGILESIRERRRQKIAKDEVQTALHGDEPRRDKIATKALTEQAKRNEIYRRIKNSQDGVDETARKSPRWDLARAIVKTDETKRTSLSHERKMVSKSVHFSSI
jgi:hypothetical protein